MKGRKVSSECCGLLLRAGNGRQGKADSFFHLSGDEGHLGRCFTWTPSPSAPGPPKNMRDKERFFRGWN